MGITNRHLLALILVFPGCLVASPKLRLSASTVGPVSVAQGANGPAQTIEAYNIGDGSLSLSVQTDTASSSWLGAAVGAQRSCTTRAGVCTPIQFALNTSGLPAGATTGIVTVSDPNAVDAPQTVMVTVQVGGGLPSNIDIYASPGNPRDMTLYTNSQVNARSNAGWLSLALDGSGSFRFPLPYRLRVAPAPAMAAGTYTGTVTTSGSTFAPDNKTIVVAMHVVPAPIAVPSTDRLSVRLAQGAPLLSTTVSLSNVGQGLLTVSDVSSTGGSWLASAAYSGGAALNIDPGSLDPGTYSGSVTINSNGAGPTGSITVPIDFTVVPKGAPLIRYQGVVDNGTFGAGDTVARGDVMVVLGEQLSFAPLTVGQAPPLAAQIGGAKVLVNGVEAPMYYSLYGQLAFQMPYETTIGSAEIQVSRDGQLSNKVSVDVAARAPRLLLIGVGTYGAIVNQDGSIPMPIGAFPGVNTHPARAGDTLTIYAIGLGPVNPSPGTGQPAPASEPLARLTTTPSINFGASLGGTPATPLFAGLTPTYAGLYQVNVTIPQNVPRGLVNLTLIFPGSVSNAVQIMIQ